MRRAWLMSVRLALVPALPAAEADRLVQQALAAEARFDTPAALVLYQQADALRPNDAVILQKISRQYSDSSSDVADPAERRQRCTTALAYAQRAVALQPRSAVNVLSLAICYGKLGLYSDTRTKIEYSRLVKQHADDALALDPNYAYAHHVLGRWHYEVASLGLGTRWIVRLIYGGLPEASTAEAVRQLRRAIELSPDLPAHRVELGFALLAGGQRAAARQAFELALTMPAREKYDEEAQRRARAALEKFR
jgi:tetratricopeptide (TPR) repeat protein